MRDRPVSIGSVQGTGDVSPGAGQVVTVRGTAVADYEGSSPALRGFYLQDAGDGDAATSDGITPTDITLPRATATDLSHSKACSSGCTRRRR